MSELFNLFKLIKNNLYGEIVDNIKYEKKVILNKYWAVNKGNSNIPLFESHKSIERKHNKSGLKSKTEGST